MKFRDTYTDGTPMTLQDQRDLRILTLASIGGVALLTGGAIFLTLLAVGLIVGLPLLAFGSLTAAVLYRREQ